MLRGSIISVSCVSLYAFVDSRESKWDLKCPLTPMHTGGNGIQESVWLKFFLHRTLTELQRVWISRRFEAALWSST